MENMIKLSSSEEKGLSESKPRGMPIILWKNNFQRWIKIISKEN